MGIMLVYLSLFWGDIYTKELGEELSFLLFCKTKNQPGLIITEMGQSQNVSAECLFLPKPGGLRTMKPRFN